MAKKGRSRKGYQLDPGQKRGKPKWPGSDFGLKGGGYDIVEWTPTRSARSAPHQPIGYTSTIKEAGSPAGQVLHRRHYDDALMEIYRLVGAKKKMTMTTPGYTHGPGSI